MAPPPPPLPPLLLWPAELALRLLLLLTLFPVLVTGPAKWFGG